MTRRFYTLLIALHPPGFRLRFGDQMLCIFDEAGTEGALPLCVDAFVSVLRQWILRAGSWKLLAALLGALMQLALASFAWMGATHRIATNPALRGGTEASPHMGMLLLLTAGAVTVIMMSVTALAVWMGRFSDRRIAHTPGKRKI